jgi:hypothetical protein
MANVPTGPNTLGMLQAVQGLILGNVLMGGVSPFASLNAADAARYGVARAVYIGAPKDFKDAYLPQCQIVPEEETVALAGAQGRAEDVLAVRVMAVVSFTDWWAAEQQILALRDAIWPVLLAHVRGGASVGTGFVALDPAAGANEARRGGFGLLEVAGVWYRTWTCHLDARQVWAATGGLVP